MTSIRVIFILQLSEDPHYLGIGLGRHVTLDNQDGNVFGVFESYLVCDAHCALLQDNISGFESSVCGRVKTA